MIRIEPGSGVPLEDQIRAGFKELVLRGQLKPGDVMPEVNSLAEMLRIGPASVSQAYQSMTKDGFLSHSPDGWIVSEQAWSQSADHLVNSVQNFIGAIQEGRRLGLSWQDFNAIVEMMQSQETRLPASAATQILKRLCIFGRNRAGSGPAQCPYCREQIAGQDIACCFICGTAYHQDCWNESGRCSVFGCKGTVTFALRE